MIELEIITCSVYVSYKVLLIDVMYIFKINKRKREVEEGGEKVV